MQRFCKDLKKHATEIINHEKKEMIPLTNEENKSYEKQKVCYICKKELTDVLIKMIKMHLNYIMKSKIIAIAQENLEELLFVI